MPTKLTHEEYIKRLKSKNQNLHPVETYNGYYTKIKHYCNICKNTIPILPRSILKNPKCPACNNYILFEGINDLKTTEPVISSWLLNSDDATKYKTWSNKKVDWICPNCNNIVRDKSVSSVVRYRKVPCQICNDGVSIPMKMTTYVISQCVKDYKTEFVFKDWNFKLNDHVITPRYDIVFDKYIIEVDGGFHYKSNTYNNMNVSVQQYIDQQKDTLAITHGYQIIRINAKSSDFNFLKQSIIDALNQLFDMSKINWEECINYATSSNMKKVWDYKNSNASKSSKEIAKDLHIPYGTVMGYLRIGSKYKKCIYDPQFEKDKSLHAERPYKCKKVICLDTAEVFDSLTKAINWCGLSTTTSISDVCIGKRGYGGKHPVTKEKLHWMYYEDYLNKAEVI